MSGREKNALSESNSSLVHVPSDQFIVARVTRGQDGQYLSSTAGYLLASRLLDMMSAQGTLLVNEPGLALASSLARLAAEQDKHVCFTTEGDAELSQWISIHPRTPERQLRALLPEKVSVFFDFSTNKVKEDTLGSRIKTCLSTASIALNAQSFLGKDSFVRSDLSSFSVLDLLKTATLKSRSTAIDIPWSNMALFDLPGNHTPDPMAVIDWHATPTALVKVNPVDPGKMFAKDKTYLLLGLTGRIGKSLCEHMIAHGARYIVLTSRRPRIDGTRLESIRALGATVKVFANDVTDESDVRQLYHVVSETLPSIAGVVNGEMALHSAPFSEMGTSRLKSKAFLFATVSRVVTLGTYFRAKGPEYFLMRQSLTSLLCRYEVDAGCSRP
jgi:hybrid polyketide synthase/nonribosomal peptide synthetase ACE1